MDFAPVIRHLEVVRFARIVDLAHLADLDPRTVRARVGHERWPTPFPGLVGLPGLEMDARDWAQAAAIWVGGEVAITRWTAAYLYGVHRVPPHRVALLVPSHRRARRHPRLEVTRARRLRAAELTRRGDLPVVTVDRLVRDLAAVSEATRLRSLVIDLVQRRLLRLEELQRVHDRSPTYPGRTRVGAVLEDLAAAGRTDSPPELEVRRRLEAAGLVVDRGQVAVPCRDGRTVHLDLGIARLLFGIEFDSMAAHSERLQLEADARRSNQLVAVDDDWRILRLTWADLGDGRWPEVLDLIFDVVGAQARRLGVAEPV